MNATLPLEAEMRAFEAKKDELERVYPRKFVVFHGDALLGAWDTLDAAAENAVSKFGSGPYLIRQVGVPAPRLPASVFFRHMASI